LILADDEIGVSVVPRVVVDVVNDCPARERFSKDLFGFQDVFVDPTSTPTRMILCPDPNVPVPAIVTASPIRQTLHALTVVNYRKEVYRC